MSAIEIAIQRLPHGADLPLPAPAGAGAAGADLRAAIGHDGEWCHVGTPHGLAATRVRLAVHRIGR